MENVRKETDTMTKLVVDMAEIIKAFERHTRVNSANKTVEVFDEYGVKLVLRNLTENQYEVFKYTFPNV